MLRLLAGVLLGAAGSAAAFAQNYKAGDDVVVIAQPGADLKVENDVVGKAWAGNHLRVEHVNQNWLFVSSGGNRGWLIDSGVLPIRTPEERRKAIAHFTQLLQKKPDPVLYNARGLLHAANGNRDAAIRDYNDAVKQNEKYWSAYSNRGNEWLKAGAYDKAIADYNRTLALDPKNAAAFFNRGIARKAQRKYAEAAADYEEVLKIEPKHLLAHNNLAWLLATCPDDAVRNGQRAVEVATAACEMSDWEDAGRLDTLAAACAEAGDFMDAVKWQTAAVALASKEEKAQYEARMKLYEESKPYREEAP